MVRRRNQHTLSDANEQRITKLEQQLAQVLASNERLQRENELLRKQNERLQKQVELLQTEVEELKRAGKRHRLRNCTTQTGSLFKLGWHLLI